MNADRLTAFRGALTAAGFLAALGAAPAVAQMPSTVQDCAKLRAVPRDYIDCLGMAQKEAERRLERALAGATAAIEARDGIQPVQRKRWIALMDEAQSRFILWRNFECQAIAPYEGGGAEKSVGGRLGAGIGALEQRFVCQIELNGERAADLGRRYPPPAGWTYVEPAPPPAPSAGPSPAAPTRVIEMPR